MSAPKRVEGAEWGGAALNLSLHESHTFKAESPDGRPVRQIDLHRPAVYVAAYRVFHGLTFLSFPLCQLAFHLTPALHRQTRSTVVSLAGCAKYPLP